MTQRLFRLADIYNYKYKILSFAAKSDDEMLKEHKGEMLGVLRAILGHSSKTTGVLSRFNAIRELYRIEQSNVTPGGKQRKGLAMSFLNAASEFGTKLEEETPDNPMDKNEFYDRICTLLVHLNNITNDYAIYEKIKDTHNINVPGKEYRDKIIQGVYNFAKSFAPRLEKIKSIWEARGVDSELVAQYNEPGITEVGDIDMKILDRHLIKAFLLAMGDYYGIDSVEDPLWYYIYNAPNTLPNEELKETAINLRNRLVDIIRAWNNSRTKPKFDSGFAKDVYEFKEELRNAGVKEFKI